MVSAGGVGSVGGRVPRSRDFLESMPPPCGAGGSGASYRPSAGRRRFGPRFVESFRMRHGSFPSYPAVATNDRQLPSSAIRCPSSMAELVMEFDFQRQYRHHSSSSPVAKFIVAPLSPTSPSPDVGTFLAPEIPTYPFTQTLAHLSVASLSPRAERFHF